MTYPTPSSSSPVPPRRSRLLWIGLILIALAIAIAGVAGFGAYRAIAGTVGGMQRVTAPGTHTLSLDEPGSYRIFHEHVSEIDGQWISRPHPPTRLQITLTAPDGRPIVLRPTGGETYSYGSRQGTSLYAFEADQPGEHTLTANFPEGAEPVVLAVGSGVLGLIAGIFGIVCAGFSAFVLGVIGVVLAIIGLVRRSSARGG